MRGVIYCFFLSAGRANHVELASGVEALQLRGQMGVADVRLLVGWLRAPTASTLLRLDLSRCACCFVPELPLFSAHTAGADSRRVVYQNCHSHIRRGRAQLRALLGGGHGLGRRLASRRGSLPRP